MYFYVNIWISISYRYLTLKSIINSYYDISLSYLYLTLKQINNSYDDISLSYRYFTLKPINNSYYDISLSYRYLTSIYNSYNVKCIKNSKTKINNPKTRETSWKAWKKRRFVIWTRIECDFVFLRKYIDLNQLSLFYVKVNN